MRTVNSEDGRVRKRLETWGEIAGHLGIEVRTAQRWERRMGLPVNRLSGSQAVFAFVDEIDGWLASREVRTDPVLVGAAGDSKARRDPEPVERPADLPPPTAVPSRLRWVVAAALGVAVLSAGVAFALRSSAEARHPAQLELEGRRLVATDASGQVLWFHDFGVPTKVPETSSRPDLPKLWERLDADGDGLDDLMVLVAHPDNGGSETLYCFDRNGAVKYAFTPVLTLNFEQERTSGRWAFWDIEAVPEDQSIWVALSDTGRWPAGVLRIDRDGASSLRYAQPGLVRTLKTTRHAGQLRLLAGGVNNEYGSASLAVLDPRAEPTSAPQKGHGPYTCLNCPRAQPLHYLLFQPSPLSVAEGRPYNEVFGIAVSPTEIAVSTYDSPK